MRNKALFYVPVKQEYLSRWEYYQVDHDILKELYDEVVVCSSVIDVIRNYKGVDIIFCWWWHQSSPVILLSKILRKKTSVTGAIHMFDISGEEDFYSKGILYRLSAKIALALADQNLFISQDQFHQITSHLTVKDPITVLSSLTKDHHFEKLKLLEQRKKIIETNHINRSYTFLSVVWHHLDQYKRKGIFETLEAISFLHERIDNDFKWIIIGGNGDGLEDLNSRITEMNLENKVRIVIDASPEQKREAYISSDLYIQPSWCEGFGNAVMEAMSFGLPAVVSRYTAQPEVVGDAGFILLNIEPEDIFLCLKKYMEFSLEKKLELNEMVLNRIERKFLFSTRLSNMEKALSSLNL